MAISRPWQSMEMCGDFRRGVCVREGLSYTVPVASERSKLQIFELRAVPGLSKHASTTKKLRPFLESAANFQVESAANFLMEIQLLLAGRPPASWQFLDEVGLVHWWFGSHFSILSLG